LGGGERPVHAQKGKKKKEEVNTSHNGKRRRLKPALGGDKKIIPVLIFVEGECWLGSS